MICVFANFSQGSQGSIVSLCNVIIHCIKAHRETATMHLRVSALRSPFTLPIVSGSACSAPATAWV
jgi:hypothetical protein